MNKRFAGLTVILLSVLLVVPFLGNFNAEAEPVSVEEASQVLENVLGAKARAHLQEFTADYTPGDYTVESKKKLRGNSGKLLGYVFELQPRGYYVVSTDTRLNPVIAYSYRGNFSWKDDVSNQLLYLLRTDLGLRLQAIEQKAFPDAMAEANEARWREYSTTEGGLGPVSGSSQWGPHLKFPAWHQGDPYNNQVPIDPSTGERSLVGCVATAMAQIINYWQYPNSVNFTDAQDYTTPTENVSINADSADVSDINYSDDPTINPSDGTVASLSYAAGVSVEMDYTANGSIASTSDVADALAGGGGDIEEVWNYSSARWKGSSSSDFYYQLVKDMESGKPAQMSIGVSGQLVGHSIVVDGFRSQDEYFHLNYGWGPGTNVGWYDLPDGLPAEYDTVRGAVLDILPQETSLGVYFDYTLKEVNPDEGTYSLTLEAKSYSDSPPLAEMNFTWDFGDGTSGTGEKVTHTFSGLGEVYDVTMTATSDQGFDEVRETVTGLGGMAYLLSDSLQNADNTRLENLESQLGWSGGSLEKIYLASSRVANKVYSLAEEYGITSASQLTDSVSNALKKTLPVEGRESMDNQKAGVGVDFGSDGGNLDGLLNLFPGFNRLFSKDGAAQSKSGAVINTLTLPEIYGELEELSVFTESILDNLAPVVRDDNFELEIPNYSQEYIALDNGDIAGILAYISARKASYEALISYSPGQPVMNNITVEIDEYGAMSLEGDRAVYGILKDNFVSARGNGVLDLNGDGDGDSDAGVEVLPETSFTLRNEVLIKRARDNLVRAIDWLKIGINDMPASPGPNDPEITWPLEGYLPWTGTQVTVDKSDVISLLDDLRGSLQGSAGIDIDTNFDGQTDYSINLNLGSLADDPISDLKAYLPDLVATNNSEGPLVVIEDSVNGIDSNWKIDGQVDYLSKDISINFPDPNFGGLLSERDANELIELFVFGEDPPGSWTTELTVSSPNYSDEFNNFGVKAGASDCKDSEDAEEPPPGPEHTRLFFSLSSGCSSSGELSTDIRQPVDFSANSKTWSATVETTESSGTPVTLNWDSGAFNLPGGVSVIMTDKTADSSVDMLSTGSYSYTTQENDEVRSFEIVVGQQCAEVSTTLAAGWNMFSVPGNKSQCNGPDPEAVLGDDLGPNFNLFRWNPATGGYDMYPSVSTPLLPRYGQWIQLESATEIDARVQPISTEFTVSFEEEGWHHVGNPFSYTTSFENAKVNCNGSTKPILNQTCVESYLYGWSQEKGGYVMHDADPESSPNGALRPWHGFWVKVNDAPSDLILSPYEIPPPAPTETQGGLDTGTSRASFASPPPPPASFSTEGPLKVAAYNRASTTDSSVLFAAKGEGSTAVQGIKVEVQGLNGQEVFSAESDSRTLSWNTEATPNGVYVYVASVKQNGSFDRTNVDKLLILK